MHPTLPTQALPELPSGVYEKLFSDPHLPKGALVHASPGADGQVMVYHLKSSYTYTLEDFQGQFHHLPDGEEKLSQHTNLLLQDIQTTTREIMALSEQLHQAQPSINRQTGQSEGLDHLPIPRDALKNTKGTLLAVKQKVESLKEDLGRKRETLEGLMRQRMAQAEAALVPIREMVTKLEEAVWTVELYTGRHEEIVQLLDGPPAPASTPISIRQQVLAMDEEAAVAAETGGIDSLSIEDFDQWIQADPSHLQQILPEMKGVVALVPRWKDKHHQDSYLHEKAREGNKRTYFLIRNGSRVYRICTDFFADQTLTPTATEFLDLFRRFDHFKNEYRQMEPGSREYMEAEKKRDRRQRDYMRVALILQGLIDRTVVFHPLPDQGVMVTDPAAYQEGLVEIIADAERSLLDGSERFQDFQARINEDLEPGRRIMGNFGYNFSRLRDDHDRRHPRLHPDRAESPDSYTLHTLDRRDRNQLVFLYERKDPIWLAGQGYVKAERRASCRIRSTDTFVLAFDHPEVTVEKLQGFLHRRTERHNYLDMFPLLKALIQQKKQEQAEEEPFKWLLASQAMQTLNLSAEQASELVPLSIERYKFKKKVHRALVEQDTGSEAFLQCMAEMQFLMAEHQNRQHKQTSGVFDALVSQVLEAHPEAVLVAHRKGDEYVAYVPETPDDHVFMRVLTLTFRKGHLKVTEDLRWKTLIKNHHRWHALYSTERLKGWKFYARADEHLTDMEITQLGGQLTELFMQHHSRKDAYEQDHRILAVTFDLDEHKFRVYHHTLKRYGFSTKLQRCVLRTTPKVTKDSGGVQVTHWHNSRDMQGETLPWEDSEERNHFGFTRRRRERVLFLHESHLHTLQEQRLEAQKERERRQTRARQLQSLLTALHQQWLQLFWEQTHDKFMQEYGDLTLWEGFKKMIREPSSPMYQTHRNTLEKLLGFVLDHQQWAGRVVEEVLQAHNLQHGDAVLDLPEALRALRVPEVNDAV